MATRHKSKNCFVADTSGIISLINQEDSNHEKAVSALNRLSENDILLLIPWDVLVETVNYLGKRSGHTKAVEVANYLLHNPHFLLAYGSEDTQRNGFVRFEKQPRSVSFIDCLVMQFADEYNTKQIFGFDQVFKKNGYVIIP